MSARRGAADIDLPVAAAGELHWVVHSCGSYGQLGRDNTAICKIIDLLSDSTHTEFGGHLFCITMAVASAWITAYYISAIQHLSRDTRAVLALSASPRGLLYMLTAGMSSHQRSAA